MPGACRAEQDSAGGTIARGSRNVFVNDRPLARVGDQVSGHGSGKHGGPVMATGSSTVKANGISACKEGDIASCGHSATGSNNVRIGG
jgi:uncharacterized Zn-binding protein involved in type VI secretion